MHDVITEKKGIKQIVYQHNTLTYNKICEENKRYKI